ncbi:CcoQ/FixQ family Cbb3-type cytochrome c oxidase assembly chaperone [Mariprofundus ferrooxydans]|nr:CcoQ/FixQ family Cbb3-type cytochrome c oxidase assembly chaperone [Mariprofundus ferrooxydans]
MNNIIDFFSTDWDAMTHADWSGLVIVVVLSVLMAGLYYWIFKPSNRDHFEQHRDFVNEDNEHRNDEDMHREAAHGQKR